MPIISISEIRIGLVIGNKDDQLFICRTICAIASGKLHNFL